MITAELLDDEFNDFNYYRGNVYTKNALNEDGTVKVVTADEIVYDTLSNGKVIARNLPGEIKQVPIDENETYLRTNFNRSNEINFRDGDRRSSRNYYQSFGEDEGSETSSTSNMYNSPKHRITRDSLGNIIKGGSWKDREYWLDPAQRRYFPQDMATDYIGFRCAMSRVGSKSKMKHKKKN